MKTFKRYTVLILVLLATAKVIAQDAKPAGRVLCAVAPDESGIAIKWIARAGYFTNGAELYRKEGAGAWVKLETPPLVYDQNFEQAGFQDEESYKMFRAIGSVEYATFESSMVKGLAIVKAVQSNHFAQGMGIYYVDKTAVKGNTYSYKVMGKTADQSIELLPSDPITFGSFSTPAAPDSMRFVRTKKAISIGWKPEVMRYYAVNIYRKIGNGEFELITPGTKPMNPAKGGIFPEFLFIDDQIEKDQDYTYKITAIDYFANESAEGAILEVKAIDLDPPALPTSLNPGHLGIENKIFLEWELDENNDATKADVYLRQSSQEERKLIASDLDPKSGRFEHAIPGKGVYYLTLILTDAAGNVTTCPEAIVSLDDIMPPPSPSGFMANADTGVIRFSWNAVQADDFEGYILYQSAPDENNLDNQWTALNTIPMSETTYELILGENMTQSFAYYIASADDKYNHSAPADIKVVKLPDVTAPAKPIIKSIAITEDDTNQYLVVKWLPNADTDLKGYQLFKSEKGSDAAPEQVNFSLIPAVASEYTDVLAEAGIRYQYTLVALDSTGLSSEKSELFYGGLPKAAEDIAPAALDIKVNQRKQTAVLSWNNGPDKAALVGYTVFRAESGKTMKPVSGLVKGTQYKDANLKEGTTYTYEIRAYSTTGFEVKSAQQDISIKSVTQ